MIGKLGECDVCKNSRYIVNRKHMCCAQCNTLRINGADSIAKKKEGYIQSMRSVENSNKISQKSNRQSIKDQSYHSAKLKYVDRLKDEDKYVCTGCGNPNAPSLSHLIRRSRRGDLVDVEENMTIHCLVRQDGSEGCHGMWEDITQMYLLDDFDDNMTAVRKMDIEYYWLVVGKLRDLGCEINIDAHKDI
tara:strand:- start:24134 stop:24703 length:570 start_codon:yes stop_codon:yes gene_type:complete